MKEVKKGLIQEVFEKYRLISILNNNKLVYFYFSKPLFQSLGSYLNDDVFIFFETTGKTKIVKGRKAEQVDKVVKLVCPRERGTQVYYDVNVIKQGITELVNEIEYKIFLDLEMSMPPFNDYENFVSEIIQCGIVITDVTGKIINTYSTYILPTVCKKISDRTIKFLHIKQEDVDQGIPFADFYQNFKEIIDQYDPMIVVWGRNDILSLSSSYKRNNLPKLDCRYIDLLKLHRNYFGLKNDLGLFNVYRKYKGIETSQEHNALTDAFVTKEVFDVFKKICNNEVNISFEEE